MAAEAQPFVIAQNLIRAAAAVERERERASGDGRRAVSLARRRRDSSHDRLTAI